MLTLAITGFEAEPDRVSQILQLDPTAVARKGIITLPSKKAKTFNGWWREAHPKRLFDEGSTIDVLPRFST